jgi:hypothetical protein
MKKTLILLSVLLVTFCKESRGQDCSGMEYPIRCADGSVICTSSPEYDLDPSDPSQDTYLHGGPVREQDGCTMEWGVNALFLNENCVDIDQLNSCIQSDFDEWTELCPGDDLAAFNVSTGLGDVYTITPETSDFPTDPNGDIGFAYTHDDVNGDEIDPDGSSTDLNYSPEMGDNGYIFVTCDPSVPSTCFNPGGKTEVDICYVMLHEIGHLLGLLDFDENPCPDGCGSDAVMGGSLPDDAGNCYSQGLTGCDICYFQSLYCEFLPERVKQSNLVNNQPFSLGNCIPSPFINFADVAYNIGATSVVDASLYDILGNIVEHVYSGYEEAGSYSFRIDGTRISAGVYYLRVSSGSQVKTIKVIKSN